MPRAYKAHPDHPAVDYLVRLHADLGGQIEANRQEAKRLAGAMRHVEAVIKLFDPAYSLRAIAARRRRKVNAWFKRGTMGRAILDVLKAATEPLPTRTIAERMLATRGIAEPDPADVRDLESGVRAAIRQSLAKHLLADGSKPARWRLFAGN
jgi:hypothetical protein